MTATTKIIATAIMAAAASFVLLVSIANQNDKRSADLDRELAKIKVVRILKASGAMDATQISNEISSGWSSKHVAQMCEELVKDGKVASERATRRWGGSYMVYSAE